MLRTVSLIVIAALLTPRPVMAGAATCGADGLPRDGRDHVAEKFAGWKIVELQDLSKDDQQLWLSNYKDLCAGIVKGNFVGTDSYGVTLIRYIHGYLYQTLLLVNTKKATPNFITLSKAGLGATPSIIQKVPPGVYYDAEHRRRVKTSLDAIAYTKLGASTELYYFANGKLKTIEISK